MLTIYFDDGGAVEAVAEVDEVVFFLCFLTIGMIGYERRAIEAMEEAAFIPTFDFSLPVGVILSLIYERRAGAWRRCGRPRSHHTSFSF
jgi:hypothetical protein